MSVIVVGAGLSGLTAARALADAGVPVTVLEGDERIAGRTKSTRDPFQHGQHADLGAAFIDLGQNAILDACLDREIALTEPFTIFGPRPDGPLLAQLLSNRLFVGDRLLSVAEGEHVGQEIADALAGTPPAFQEPMPAYARRAGLSEDAARALCGLAGMNPQCPAWQVPMAYFGDSTVGQHCWHMADGADSLARALADGLDVRCGEVVEAIGVEDGHVVVVTGREHVAERVVVTASVATTLNIAFAPILPAWKTTAIADTPMSPAGKIAVQLADGERVRAALTRAVLADGPIPFLKPGPVSEQDSVIVTGLLTGGDAEVIPPADQLVDTVVARVRALAGVEPEVLGSIVKDWAADPLVGGAVGVQRGVNAPAVQTLLAQPVGPVHFAGEHTADLWRSAMDGAIRSGARAAREVLVELGVEPAAAAAV